MKKMRNKGKVHPFTSSPPPPPPPPPSSSSNTNSNNAVDDSSTSNKDAAFFVLTLLPAAILAVVSALPLDDREVLAYMITRSLKSTTTYLSLFPAEGDKKKISTSSKKQQQHSFDHGGHNSPALFDCECFHCYTGFWLRWDSSPNRDLIHHAIEAFEEEQQQQCILNNGETRMSSSKKGKSKRKDKMGRRKSPTNGGGGGGGGGGALDFSVKANQESGVLEVQESDVAEEVPEVSPENELVAAPVVVEQRSHRGLVRKVLPDVVGILNSRLWRLWSPNV